MPSTGKPFGLGMGRGVAAAVSWSSISVILVTGRGHACRRARIPRLGQGARHYHSHRGSDADRGVDSDRTLQRVSNKIMDNGHAQPRTSLAASGRKERLVHMGEVAWLDAHAMIYHHDAKRG